MNTTAWSWLFAHQAETGLPGKPDHNQSRQCPHCPPDYTPRGVATADNLATDH